MGTKSPTVTLEGVEIVFTNFAGKEKQFNTLGDRNFNVILTDELAERMLRDGWNVKTLKSREEEEESRPRLEVKVSYKYRPPRIVLISSAGRTLITEDTCEILDSLEFSQIDMVVRGHLWEVGDKSGVKAYLQSMYLTLEEDDLDRKYAIKPKDHQDD